MIGMQWIPNSITGLRAVCALYIACALFVPSLAWLVPAVALIGVLSDKLDGTLARILNAQTVLGKRLESVVDPLFSVCGGVYVLLRTDFPVGFFWYGLILFILTSLPRFYIYLRYKKFFSEKSEITRFSTALIFLTILLYIFQVPYREYLVYIETVLGTLTCINYVRLQMRFIEKQKRAV
ncbi:MAG: CDP-alcohol phosphatidyltransferase family protein [Candidatus Kerfeldbacteria bacterium]|nr:CDP-alcohol phosphatidyltransferase family protein [Candidatus Kerfeldbacteria bacterium]